MSRGADLVTGPAHGPARGAAAGGAGAAPQAQHDAPPPRSPAPAGAAPQTRRPSRLVSARATGAAGGKPADGSPVRDGRYGARQARELQHQAAASPAGSLGPNRATPPAGLTGQARPAPACWAPTVKSANSHVAKPESPAQTGGDGREALLGRRGTAGHSPTTRRDRIRDVTGRLGDVTGRLGDVTGLFGSVMGRLGDSDSGGFCGLAGG